MSPPDMREAAPERTAPPTTPSSRKAPEGSLGRTADTLPPLPGADELAIIHTAFEAGMDHAFEQGYRAGRLDERTAVMHRRAVRIVHSMAEIPERDHEADRAAAARREEWWSNRRNGGAS